MGGLLRNEWPDWIGISGRIQSESVAGFGRNMHTSSSWLNLVERWFREITDKRIRRGTFTNVPSLIDAIMAYIEGHNQDPTPFVWSAPVERILARIANCKEGLGTLH